MEKKKVLLGMSGGVDSSVAAILLLEQGYDVYGVTMKLWEDDSNIQESCLKSSASKDAKDVCDKLGIPHCEIELKKEFKKYVVDDFICRYAECKTPNPCVECNRYLKFGAMYEKAKELGIDYLATGHYAKVTYNEEFKRYAISKAKNHKKDQSYFLYNISKDVIEKLVFPLGDYEDKEEIRQIAKNYNLNIAQKPDSQEICFIPNDNYISFLQKSGDIKLKPGNVENTKGEKLGTHKGLYCYTVGQRKGIGISNASKLYVTKLDKEDNKLILGSEEELYSNETYIEKVNLHLIDKVEEPIKVEAKVRYAAKPAFAILYPEEDNKYRVVFEEKQRAMTPGQSIVFYIGDCVLGGGKII